MPDVHVGEIAVFVVVVNQRRSRRSIVKSRGGGKEAGDEKEWEEQRCEGGRA